MTFLRGYITVESENLTFFCDFVLGGRKSKRVILFKDVVKHVLKF